MALVIGHSQAKYLSQYLDRECYSVFAYQGYNVSQFECISDIFEVAPFFSVVVLLVGANDIGYKRPDEIVTDICSLCDRIRDCSPSATVIVSEVLPRAQNMFEGCQLDVDFLDRWNWDAGTVNQGLRQVAKRVSWFNTIDQYEFHTWFGTARHLLSREGLHLSHEGTETLVSNIESAVRPSLNYAVRSTPSQHVRDLPSSNPVRSTPSRHNLPVYNPPSSNPWRSAPSQHKFVRDLQSSNTVRSEAPSRHKTPVIDLPSAPTFCTGVPSRKRNIRRSQQSQSSKYSQRSKHKKAVPVKLKSKCHSECSNVFVIESKRKYYLSCDKIQLEGGGGENTVPVWSETDSVLTHHEAADILIQNIPGSTTSEPPYRPRAGTTYLFDENGDENKREDWRADGYTWRNYGKKKYIVNGQKLERYFFKISNQGVVSDTFQKHAFRFVDSDYNGRVFLVSFGDSAAYHNLPHKNRTKSNRPHKRTKPSVINEIKARCLDEKPTELEKNLCSEKSNNEKKGVGIPRNEDQIKNIAKKIRKDRKLTHDALYSLHLLEDQLDGYIIYTKTIPDLEVILGNKEIFQK